MREWGVGCESWDPDSSAVVSGELGLGECSRSFLPNFDGGEAPRWLCHPSPVDSALCHPEQRKSFSKGISINFVDIIYLNWIQS